MTFRTLLAVILLGAPVFCQSATKPGREVKKLDYFVGSWTVEGTIPPGPWGAGGKYSITHDNEWMTGNFFLICRTKSKMPLDLGGETESISFTGYDVDKKVYTDTGFDSHGGNGVSQGNLDGDAFTWRMSEKLSDGQVIQQRETNKMLSPTRYTTRFEVSDDGTNWTVMMESIVTKK